AATMPVTRLLHAYATECRYELLRTLRQPIFLFPMLALPVLLYLFFGIVLAGPQAGSNPQVALYVFSGFAMFSVVGPGMFGFGIGLAVERSSGLLTLKRALPMPAGANFAARMVASMAAVALVLAMLIPLAKYFGNVPLPAGKIMSFAAVGILGVLPLCAIGLLVGSYVSGTAAPGVVNLIY